MYNFFHKKIILCAVGRFFEKAFSLNKLCQKGYAAVISNTGEDSALVLVDITREKQSEFTEQLPLACGDSLVYLQGTMDENCFPCFHRGRNPKDFRLPTLPDEQPLSLSPQIFPVALISPGFFFCR